jgi:hypothetical protein
MYCISELISKDIDMQINSPLSSNKLQQIE